MAQNSTANRPDHHANDCGTSFRNPWLSAGKPSWTELLPMRSPLSRYCNESLKHDDRAREIKVVTPDWGASALKQRMLENEEETCIVGTWLGHAAAMAEIPLEGVRAGNSMKESPETLSSKSNLWILFDPIFSQRAGPTQYTGPGRIKASPCQVDDLPECDAVAISHNHYDHLDTLSIKAISSRFPRCKFFVPLGNKSWLLATGIPEDLIRELDWWKSAEFGLEDFHREVDHNTEEETKLCFTCVPAQHNSGRGTLDQGSTLWCGWVVEQHLVRKSQDVEKRRKGAIYHAGDTGYRRIARSEEVCPVFEEIGTTFGPFDLSFIPIWRGGTLSFISYVGLRLSHNEIPSALHASPADAIAIHLTVRSKNTVGVHFGTFIGSENESYEALIEFDEARENAGGIGRLDDISECHHGRAGALDIGGSIAVGI
ncbi:metallo-hydrolase [Coleophoma cylindrospora]|uniref:Metallo-hydrolase n=1 Tax=Coleophoma cylindrospora TaxID=1849047 RepID=A0A3D8RTN7_9HELO|nr:metallo-hydrolase [Coleophoma cylindrospora]